jgi:hypothetical protein
LSGVLALGRYPLVDANLDSQELPDRERPDRNRAEGEDRD